MLGIPQILTKLERPVEMLMRVSLKSRSSWKILDLRMKLRTIKMPLAKMMPSLSRPSLWTSLSLASCLQTTTRQQISTQVARTSKTAQPLSSSCLKEAVKKMRIATPTTTKPRSSITIRTSSLIAPSKLVCLRVTNFQPWQPRLWS